MFIVSEILYLHFFCNYLAFLTEKKKQEALYYLFFQGNMVLTIKPADVSHRDLAVSPDSAHYRVQLPALESPECHSQVLAVHHEADSALVHIENHEELVGHYESLVGFQQSWICYTRTIL